MEHPRSSERATPKPQQERTERQLAPLLKKYRNHPTFGIFAAAFLEGCAATPLPPSAAELASFPPDHIAAERELQEKLSDTKLDSAQRQALAHRLMGTPSGTAGTWALERGRRLARPSAAATGLDAFGEDAGAFRSAWAYLPKAWTSTAATGSFGFLPSSEFRTAHVPKDGHYSHALEAHGGKVACVAESVGTDPSAISCDAGALLNAGARRTVLATAIHEYAHAAAPDRLPFPAATKAKLWKGIHTLIERRGPKSKYVADLKRLRDATPNAATHAAVFDEAWAEFVMTLWETRGLTQRAGDWQSFKHWYTLALRERQDCGDTEAEQAFELLRTYFDAVDPGFQPWNAAKGLETAIPSALPERKTAAELNADTLADMERIDRRRQARGIDVFEAKLKREQEAREQEIAAVRKKFARSE